MVGWGIDYHEILMGRRCRVMRRGESMLTETSLTISESTHNIWGSVFRSVQRFADGEET
jgi:hypothetical protein